MHSDEMSREVQRFFHEANELQWLKNRDYHPERIAFLEILRTAAETGISVEQDLWAKIRKQTVALRTFVIEGYVESESPRSRMMDIAVYMGMFSFWIAHKEAIVQDALDYVRDRVACEMYHGFGKTTDMGANSTCFREGKPESMMCERCRFVYWLMKRIADAH